MVALALLTLVLLACSTNAKGSDLAAGGGGAAIDWVNFLRMNGITYIANQQSGNHGTSAVSKDALGPEYARVQSMVAGNVSDPNYKIKDGDAAFWEKGTPVFTLKGFRPETLLAIVADDGILLFEPDTNDAAHSGRDLLDLQGKVSAVRILSAEDAQTEVRRVDAGQIPDLVEAVLAAPVDPNAGGFELTSFVAFDLTNGVVVVRAYSAGDGQLHRGIMLPPAARRIFDAAP